ncbi:hypothetical protein GB937_009860, partial [Aspergillus fischeri]
MEANYLRYMSWESARSLSFESLKQRSNKKKQILESKRRKFVYNSLKTRDWSLILWNGGFESRNFSKVINKWFKS